MSDYMSFVRALRYTIQDDNEQYFTPVICDDALYASIADYNQGATMYYTGENLTIPDIFSLFDSYLGNDLWSSVKAPVMYQTADEESVRAASALFPVLVEKATFPSGKNIYDSGGNSKNTTSQYVSMNMQKICAGGSYSISPSANLPFRTETNIASASRPFGGTVSVLILVGPSNYTAIDSSIRAILLTCSYRLEQQYWGYILAIPSVTPGTWTDTELQDMPGQDTDPYSQGGNSDAGGGTGNFDGTSVDVDFATLPTLSAVDTGFLTLYNPSLAQLQSLANYMWSGLFDLDTFKKLFADPMQAILGLSIVPGPVPNGGAQNVKIGNIDSGISMTKAAAQYIDIDCGTLNVEEFWGAYLDYEPYTKAEIYLPFIGVHQIAVDDIMGKAVHVKYHIDLLSGGCACEIKCGGSVLYTFVGSCAVSIPVTGNDWTNLINGVLSAAASIGTMVATGGASAPSAIANIASSAVNSLKPSIEKSGSVSGAGGLLAGMTPVLILTRPRQALPTSQNMYTGYPAFITRSLGAVSGYTEVYKIRLGGISATDAELNEIEGLLKSGVIL